jgi:hypothetical protein
MMAWAVSLPAQNVEDAIRLLRSDISAEKTAILTKSMNLTEEESAKFWPLQRAYQAEYAAIGDRRMALIKDYSTNYDTITDEKATQLGNDALKIEADIVKLRQKYFKSIAKGVSPKAAARFMQIETQMQRIIDLQRADLVPLMK